MPAIVTRGLCKTYGGSLRDRGDTAALRDLDLTVNEGEVFGFLGPNGAGKTTTINLLLNFTQPTAGEAFVFDRPVANTEIRSRMGYMPESVNLHDYYRGRKLLEFYAGLAGVAEHARGALIDRLLDTVKLTEAADKRVSKYSKGMTQRMGLAQALLGDPDLLILDEPTASLDPVGRKEFRDVLVDLKRQGKTVFISSHILSEVESVCDRVAIVEQGVLKRVGTLAELSAGTATVFHVRSLPAMAIETLQALGVELTIAREGTTIRCVDAATRDAVADLLALHGVAVERTEGEAQSLEQIFMSAIDSGKPQ